MYHNLSKIIPTLLILLCPLLCSAQHSQEVAVRAMILNSPFDTQSARLLDTVVNYIALEDCIDENTILTQIPVIAQKYIEKYSIDPSSVDDFGVFEFVDKWIGTPYRFGGESRKGVDCSGLTKEFFATLKGVDLPRSSREMYASDMVETSKQKDISQLQAGDLLFFRSRGSNINHVAVYICQGRFLTANRNGVQLSSLDEPYWKKHYYAYGRVKEEFLN